MSGLGKVACLAVWIWGAAPRVEAQSAAEHVALGDAAYDQRRPQEAREHFLKAIAADARNYEALWKASRVEVDLAEAAPKGVAMDSLMAAASSHAEAAIAARPADAEGHFSLARAMGRKALSVGTMDRIRYSKIVRSEALDALKYDSTHAGGLHVLGMWNAEIMRVNGFARAFAKTFLGAQVFGLANWDEAQRLLEAAVRHDPKRIVHRLDLAGIYADRGDKAKAKELYEWIATAPIIETNDDLYKRQAAERLKKL
jgi:tetratricopeptide (TPR) repeat protein